ncbi:AAA family ATPase [uncultured Sulfitobacter sp.]|uniref:AAA family ATPase n=1 Tax=uncultured Sulfitobacter sp. TaxID=191468 RepID=UPI0026103A99|nr:AAA family ATPase [uncultured Sulfitobacter sp.]
MGPSTEVAAQGAQRSAWSGGQRPSPFFETEEISSLVKRGLFYARAGVPLNFQGAAGLGKTSIALEIARRLGRKVSLMAGNDWLGSDDLIGKEVGQSAHSVVDKYVQRVRRSEASLRYDWEASLLGEAMREGHTLVYDEFTRSSAKANGILLSVLEEGILITTDRLADAPCIEAHPDFRIILTSNPHDYAGVNSSPDALLDRMLTFRLKRYNAATEAGIVSSRTGLDAEMSTKIVRLVRGLQKQVWPDAECSMRAGLMIARIAAVRQRSVPLSDALIAQIVADVLNGRGAALTTREIAQALADAA